MKKKSLIVGGLVVLILGGIALMRLGATRTGNVASEQQSGPASLLTTAEPFYDFGTISMRDGLVDYVFKVANPTAADIQLKKIATSCMCTTAYLESSGGEKGPFGMEGMGTMTATDEIIKAGQSRGVRVVYDPNAHGPAGVGAVDRLVQLTDAAGGVLQLQIKAVATP